MIKIEKDGYTPFSTKIQLPADGELKVEATLSRRGNSSWYAHWYVLAIGGAIVAGAAGGTITHMATRDRDPDDGPGHGHVLGAEVAQHHERVLVVVGVVARADVHRLEAGALVEGDRGAFDRRTSSVASAQPACDRGSSTWRSSDRQRPAAASGKVAIASTWSSVVTTQ